MKKKLFTLLLALAAIATTAGAQNKINGHEYVDLELPSGTLWATCNVGATKPEEYGDYFAWGETEPKEDYSWETYKWGMYNALTKYTETDGKTVLDPEDDAATANWGGKWRMPTSEEIYELLNNTTHERTTVNGVTGDKFTAKDGSGNFIFLPASGDFSDKKVDKVGVNGGCWSSTLKMQGSNSNFARYLYAYSGTAFHSSAIRFAGHAVRPVSSKDVVQNGIAINATNFPDANFRGYVSANTIDKDEDGYLSDEEIAKVTTMYVYGKSIANLTGIEHFTALTDLRCYENKLTSLDVSKNTALTYLDCTDNDLTELDLSKNTALKELWCFGNRIKGDKMQALVNSLPMVSSGTFGVINTKDSSEENVITKSQVTIAKNKGWKYVYDWNDGYYKDYAGSDDPTTGLTAVESGQLTVDSYYSIDGRKLQGKPTKKGVYIKNGRKIVK